MTRRKFYKELAKIVKDYKSSTPKSQFIVALRANSFRSQCATELIKGKLKIEDYEKAFVHNDSTNYWLDDYIASLEK